MINERQAHKFCKDDISKIENYEEAMNDKTQTWHCHHRLELTLDGEFALTSEQLKIHDMYYNRPYYELIFLTPAEHKRLHNKDKCLSDDIKQRISESLKGISRTPFTEEHRRKLSESLKGHHHSEETRRKLSESLKGHHHSDETLRKISESMKGKLKGISKSIEHRRKISESVKRRWAATKK